jgi:anthranilate synthase component 2
MHYLEALDTQVKVVRNEDLSRLNIKDYNRVLISPGPGIPKEAGQLMSFLKNNYSLIPILGVCLGQQALGELFGATLSKLPEAQHGKQKEIRHFGNDSI